MGNIERDRCGYSVSSHTIPHLKSKRHFKHKRNKKMLKQKGNLKFALGIGLLMALGCTSKNNTQSTPPLAIKIQKQEKHEPYKQTLPESPNPIELAAIPAGSFLMGSPETEQKRNADEGPQIKVNIKPFWMSKHEITWGQFKGYEGLYHKVKNHPENYKPKNASDYDAISFPTPMYPQETVPIFAILGKDHNHPVVSLSRFAASQYCKWLSKKNRTLLPSPHRSGMGIRLPCRHKNCILVRR